MALEFYLASIGSWVTVVEGAVFVVCVLAFREGIVGVRGAAAPPTALDLAMHTSDTGPDMTI